VLKKKKKKVCIKKVLLKTHSITQGIAIPLLLEGNSHSWEWYATKQNNGYSIGIAVPLYRSSLHSKCALKVVYSKPIDWMFSIQSGFYLHIS
jgi:hypothetical protein